MSEEPALDWVDDRVVEMIAERVAAHLRTELEELAATASGSRERPLTVEQVAERFGVARSTVYAHWREWGGYKLGRGGKAAIRFDPSVLPTEAADPDRQRGRDQVGTGPRTRQRRRTAVLRGEPRLPGEFESGG